MFVRAAAVGRIGGMKHVRVAAALVVLIAVLSAAREACAWRLKPTHDYTVVIAGRPIGFQDYQWVSCSLEELSTNYVQLGPLGEYEIPFTATQGLVGCGLMAAMLVALPAVCWRRWRRVS